MANLQYMPGDPRLIDQLVYELKSKGIFDQFRKECIADVDTRPAYQNLRQRVENSVTTFLSRQCWKPDLNKNQLREKLRKHILDGNYLEQGVERIVDQVVNPKVASVFIPQVEDLVYKYLGITRKKTVPAAETSNEKSNADDLLPTDLEAVSPGSVKSNEDKEESVEKSEFKDETKMEIDQEDKPRADIKEDSVIIIETDDKERPENQETQLSGISDLNSCDSDVSMDKSNIPLPTESIKVEDIPPPENSPPKIELEKIELPKEPNLSTDIPLPDEIPKDDSETYFKPINTDDDDSSSDSSLRRNMSPLTPIRNFNNENSYDAQQAFENDLEETKNNDIKEPSSFRFAIENNTPQNKPDDVKMDKKESDPSNLSYQFNMQVNLNNFNTPLYEDSSNSNNLQIDYESDANSKTNADTKGPETDQNSEDSKKEQKSGEKKSSHKKSHRSRDSHRHSSSSKDKRSDSKHSRSRDRKDSKHEKKSSKDDQSKSKSSNRERPRDRGDKKSSRDSSKHRSSHKSSSHKDSKSHRSSSSSRRHSSKNSDEKKSSSSSQRDKSEKSSERSSKDHRSKDSKHSSHRSDKDKKSSSSTKSKHEDKEKEKKDKKETDDHYSLSGRGSHSRRSTDRDSNDGSSSSKGSNNQTSSKSSDTKKDAKGSSSKSENTSSCGDSTSPSDKEIIINETKLKSNDVPQYKPIVRVDTHLETPISTPPRLPFVPDVTIKKPKFAANFEEAKRLMKMRKFLDEEQKRMNQEAALLLEFQANVRPSLSQVYSSIPGPELEFACVTNTVTSVQQIITQPEITYEPKPEQSEFVEDTYNSEILTNAQSKVTNNTVSNDQNDHTFCEVLSDSNNLKENADAHTETQKGSAVMEIVETEENRENSESLPNTEINFVSIQEEENRKRTEYFEVTIITEEVSENEEFECDHLEQNNEILQNTEENPLQFFAEHEKYSAELERDRFSKFLKEFIEKSSLANKMFLINCDTYEENIFKDVLQKFGQFEVVNYYKNGHLKLPKTVNNIVKDVNVVDEITLPLEKLDKSDKYTLSSPVVSPVKSECSFELSNDYAAKLEEMVNKTSRQEIMEIILGGFMPDDSPSKMPKIGYCMESSIESDTEFTLKRKLTEIDGLDNNNRNILSPNKQRKLSISDQISSTTEDGERVNGSVINNTRSKYLGKARRVGLPRPRKPNLPNSPSSDKSVENYEENNQIKPETPNGKLKTVPKRSKVQRYDTSDLYKPKLHYLSRRNNIS